MSLFVRLSTLAVVAVLLRCVPATVDITAPSTVTAITAGVETREQGLTVWICSALAVDSPWISYANIRGYLEGGNAENLGDNRVAAKDMMEMVIYPEVSWTAGPYQKMLGWKSSKEGDLAECQTMAKAYDVTNCNQPCRGDQQPVQAIMIKPSSNVDPPFLTLCGAIFALPMAAGSNDLYAYVFSHAGYGCYPYPEAKSVQDEDCLVTFKKPAAAEAMNIFFEFDLNGVKGACQDYVSVHQSKIPDKAKNEERYCKGIKQVQFTEDFFAVNFHRMQGNKDVGLNVGFRMKVESRA